MHECVSKRVRAKMAFREREREQVRARERACVFSVGRERESFQIETI